MFSIGENSGEEKNYLDQKLTKWFSFWVQKLLKWVSIVSEPETEVMDQFLWPERKIMAKRCFMRKSYKNIWHFKAL